MQQISDTAKISKNLGVKPETIKAIEDVSQSLITKLQVFRSIVLQGANHFPTFRTTFILEMKAEFSPGRAETC